MTKTIKAQKTILIITALNFLLILFFPPFDDYSVTSYDYATFGGFRFFLHAPPNSAVNTNLLFLECAVVLIDAAIFWLISIENGQNQHRRKKFNYLNASRVLVATNLVIVMLFPPFEYVSNMSFTRIPSFEGFYFIFAYPPYRVIMTPILWIEIIFVLLNGAVMQFAFRDKSVARNIN